MRQILETVSTVSCVETLQFIMSSGLNLCDPYHLGQVPVGGALFTFIMCEKTYVLPRTVTN